MYLSVETDVRSWSQVLQKFSSILNLSVFYRLGIVNRSTSRADLSVICFSDGIFTVSWGTRFSAVSSSSLEVIKRITSSVADPGGRAWRGSAAARLLGLRLRISPGAWMSWVLCVVRERSLRQADHSSGGIYQVCMCNWVWSSATINLCAYRE